MGRFSFLLIFVVYSMVHETEMKKFHVNFFLKTRDNPIVYQKIINGHNNTLGKFNVTKPTKFLIHGYLGTPHTSKINMLSKAFLDNFDVNVIAIGWDNENTINYAELVIKLPEISKQSISFIQWLVSMGVSLQSIHLVGHSYGAQLAGFIGRHLKDGKVGYITGLDPASPLFANSPNTIRRNDADYVEVIHTDCGTFGLGVSAASGHNDFYPNGCSKMPGCGFIDAKCSHNKAIHYYNESLYYPESFLAHHCKIPKHVYSGRCSDGITLHMGGVEVKPTVGVFYLKTRKRSPYSWN